MSGEGQAWSFQAQLTSSQACTCQAQPSRRQPHKRGTRPPCRRLGLVRPGQAFRPKNGDLGLWAWRLRSSQAPRPNRSCAGGCAVGGVAGLCGSGRRRGGFTAHQTQTPDEHLGVDHTLSPAWLRRGSLHHEISRYGATRSTVRPARPRTRPRVTVKLGSYQLLLHGGLDMRLTERVIRAYHKEAQRTGSYIVARQYVMQKYRLTAARVDQMLHMREAGR